MRVNIHLSFCGQCREAFEFYENLLGGSIGLMLAYGDSPAADSVPAELRGNIVHANLVINEMEIAGADVPPDRYERPSGFNLLLEMDDQSEAKRVFKTLAEGGSILIPIGKTFWSSCYGMLVDRFGTPWEINCVD